MNADADRLDLAAEYVLGTLDAAERDEAEALIQSDTTFADMVRDWECKLGELSAMVEPVSPPPELWMAIQARCTEITPTAAEPRPEFPGPPVAASDIAAEKEPTDIAAEAAEATEATQDTEAVPAETAATQDSPAEVAAAEVEAAEPSASPPAAEGVPDEAAAAVEPGEGGIEPASPTNVIDLSRRLRRWRGRAVALGTLAAMLTAVVVTAALAPGYLPEPLRPKPVVRTMEVPRDVVRTVEVPAPAPGRFVAVLQSSASAPAFILTVDVGQKNLTVRRVAAETQPDHSYELWLISDRLQEPRSLGLIGTSEFTRPPALANYDPGTISEATFAVSLEPEGGSPTGQPTGPVLFSGKLVEAVPPTAPIRTQ